jgi:hypothetical protein
MATRNVYEEAKNMATRNVYEETKKGIHDRLKAEGYWNCMWEEEKCTEILCLRSNVMDEMRNLMQGDLGKVEGAQETFRIQDNTLNTVIQEFIIS